MLKPGFTSSPLLRSLFSTYASNGPGSWTAIQPADRPGGEFGAGTGSTTALMNLTVGEVASGFVCSAVVPMSCAARRLDNSRNATATSKLNTDVAEQCCLVSIS